MDGKNEDSGGSDSLDKSLQQKCKMDEGMPAAASSSAACASSINSKMVPEVLNVFQEHNSEGLAMASPSTVEGELGSNSLPENPEQSSGSGSGSSNVYTKYQKTDNYMLGNGINAAATEARESSLRFFKASSTINNSIFTREDSSSSGSDSSGSGSNNSCNNGSGNNHHHSYRLRTANTIGSLEKTEPSSGLQVSGVQLDDAGGGSGSGNDAVGNNNGIVIGEGDNGIVAACNNIETTVKQISRNLQETTLLETFNAIPTSFSISNTNTATNSASTTTTTTTTNRITSPSVDATSAIASATSAANSDLEPSEEGGAEGAEGTSSSVYNGPSTSQGAVAASGLNQSESETSFMASDSAEETADSRSKKVRFHPDVKENDGGNRVIPKKKKKNRPQPPSDDGTQPSAAASSSSSCMPQTSSVAASASSSPATGAAAAAATVVGGGGGGVGVGASVTSLSLPSSVSSSSSASAALASAAAAAVASMAQAASSGKTVPDKGTTTTGGNNSGSDMELDESNEEMSEDEDEFDVNRTINEAEAYLKENPITFVPPSLPNSRMMEASVLLESEGNKGGGSDSGGGRGDGDSPQGIRDKVMQLPSGLMREEDLPPSDDDDGTDDDELGEGLVVEEEEEAGGHFTSMSTDVQTHQGEHGVENIYGKRIINGEHNYLLRYVNKNGLFWETENFILANCPNLLVLYEEKQRMQQQHLMNYVSKRLSLRQRYTDF